MSWKKWNGAKVIKEFRGECSDALYKAGQTMKTQVLREIPHDEGTLQDTVVSMIDPADDLMLVVAAGGGGLSGMPEVPYAIRWHENDANFQKGRKSQYIRDPLKQVLPREVLRELKLKGLQ